MRKSGLAVVAIAAALVVLAVPVMAEQVAFHGMMVDANAVPTAPVVESVVNPSADPEPEAYGTTLWSVGIGGPCDAVLRSGTWLDGSCRYIQPSAGSISVGIPVHLPTGAVAQYVRIYFRQTVIGDTISAGFWKSDEVGTGTLISTMSPTATTAGNTFQQFGPFADEINNEPGLGNAYSFLAIFGGSTRIYKMMVYYKLQVKPGPASATFTDVPTTSGQFKFVEALVAAGITGGCGTGTFCPNSPVTRGQMAVFLASALGLAYQY